MKITTRIPSSRMFLAVLAILTLFGSAAPAADQPKKFSLEPDQTPYRDQGARGTCIAHSSIAALEAALKRAGHGQLDLSEEFFFEMAKNFYLKRSTPSSADEAENNLSLGYGGFGAGYLPFLAHGFAVPTEKDMAYQPYLQPVVDLKAPVWKNQYCIGSNNLDPRRFDPATLSRAKYYSITGYEIIAGNKPESIKAALLKKREVVFDYHAPQTRHADIWQYTVPLIQYKGEVDAHSMLIVGYDETDANPKNHHFIAKNSWKGLERVRLSYDFLRNYGAPHGATITGVAPVKSWSQIAFLGRWYAEFGGRQGVLDVYHLPGMNQMNFDLRHRQFVTSPRIIDRRVGTFFLDGDSKKAYRVNGVFTTKGLKLVIDWQNPNAAYDSLKGDELEVSFPNGDLGRLHGTGFDAVRLNSTEAFALKTPDWTTLPEVKSMRTLVRNTQPRPNVPGPRIRIVINGKVVHDTN